MDRAYAIITTDNQFRRLSFQDIHEDGRIKSFKDIQRELGGDFELVRPRLKIWPKGVVILVDSDGKLNGKDVNPFISWVDRRTDKATKLVGDAMIVAERLGGPYGRDLFALNKEECKAIWSIWQQFLSKI